MEFETLNPLLRSLEDLGSLTEKSGLVEVKPFRDWRDTTWRHKILSIRLCNAGEMQDIDTYTSELPEPARMQALKLELVIRSVFAIDGRVLVSAEEVQAYNEKAKTDLTPLQYLRIWVRNLEQLVVNRLDAVYGGLELKQVRRLQGLVLCEGCGNVSRGVPSDAKILKYSVGEILCATCLPNAVLEDYDFDNTPAIPKESLAAPAQPTKDQGGSFTFQKWTCECGKELETLEEFTAHRETCPQAGAVQA